jgi:hypothetical protein
VSSAEKPPSGAGEAVKWLALGREGIKDTQRVASIFLASAKGVWNAP